jgi:hypothetical protein
MFMHAAFLATGFHPHGAEPASVHLLKREGAEPGTRCLSRQYTAPQLVRRAGAVDAAVLLLCAQGGDVALVAFLTTERDLRGVHRERLQVSPTACCATRSPGGRGSAGGSPAACAGGSSPSCATGTACR